MNHPADEELLSAYLDGELADDERARVEQLLSELPESRQLLEELRAVKQRLQSLPAARLGEDFAERVLRQAEREMLTEGFRVQGSGFSNLSSGQDCEIGSSSASQSKIGNPKSKIGRHRRSGVWAALALAAGLLVMLFDRDRHDRRAEKQVAMAPQGADNDNRSGALPRNAEIGAAPLGGPATDEAERTPRELSDLRAEPQSSEADENQAATAAPAEDKSSSARRRMKQLDETVGERTGKGNRRARQAGGEPINQRFAFLGDSGGEPPLVDDQTLVVWCELSPDAPSEENFSQLLAQQNIAWQPASDAEQGASHALGRAGRSGQPEAFFAQNQAGRTMSVDPAKLVETLKRRGDQQATREPKAPALESLQSPGAQMVLVEATDTQVEAVLEAMDQDRQTYRTVEVEPAPQAPRQQSLAQYSRSARHLKKEEAERAGRMSVQNLAADPRLPQGRAVRLQLQAGQAAAAKKTDEPAAPPPASGTEKKEKLARSAPAPAASPALSSEVREPQSAAGARRSEPVYRVLFVLVPPIQADAKPAAAAPAKEQAPPREEPKNP